MMEHWGSGALGCWSIGILVHIVIVIANSNVVIQLNLI